MQSYSKGWKAIVRPPRTKYEYFRLGPEKEIIPQVDRKKTPDLPSQVEVKRIDFSIKNKKRQKIQCSFFKIKGDSNKLRPCVVYCHSHSSCRMEGIQLKNHFLPRFSFCVFDFTGCGLSEGDFVTLGAKEKDDIQAVLRGLKHDLGVNNFFLYGRSMGAVSIMLFLNKYVQGDGYVIRDDSPSRGVLGVILDSPFTKLKSLVRIFQTNIRSQIW